MKNIFIIFILFFTPLFKSQSVIIDIEESGFGKPSGYYQKDLNNLLDPFQGTYIFSNGNTSFKIVLKKMIKQYFASHYEDMIIGEYQYIENGLEKANTLSNLDIVYSDQYLKHHISGNSILWSNSRLWKCPQCNPNEKRLAVRLNDNISGRRADFLMRRTAINGQEVLQVKIYNISSNVINVDDSSTLNEPPFALPKGEFTMIKQ
ncbi:DUF6705 family protein [Chryseobacterium luquanense]|uniref:DUF6705 domain-containing protein n=1 Tax=Chryseobacterium luquanense TaxID=2983766 RepID=A0ABT3Y950_9FLAO|nr:DUF6705 family protein [Chryseobacterium luquanense]MCX8534697.1 hypothetical protein [Chryseobacterium luquanense]